MVENGKGSGSSTITGKVFEKEVDIVSFLLKNEKCVSKKGKYNTENIITIDDKVVARTMISHDLYKFLKDDYKISSEEIISKKLLPDGLIVNYMNNTIYIIEKKFQKVAGSVDEKLQTCAFKKRQYIKLFSSTGFNVEYVYVLNDWFKADQYNDTLSYIREVGCHYFFYDIPREFLGC